MAASSMKAMSTQSLPAPPYPISQWGDDANEDAGIASSREAHTRDADAHAPNFIDCAHKSLGQTNNGHTQTSDWANETWIPMSTYDGVVKDVPETQQRPYPVFTEWVLEMVMLAMAITSLVGLFYLLGAVDGKIVAIWPWTSFSIETAISIMVTAMVASMTYVMVQILGQACFSWFGHTLHRRPLYDLLVFSRGGDGILASLRLLMSIFGSGLSGIRTPAGVMAICCGLVTMLAFAAGPFAQQALRRVPCSWRSGPGLGSIPVANSAPFNAGHFIEYRVKYLELYLDPEMKGVLTNALANPRAGAESAIAAECPSGDCKFRDYGTGVTHSTIGLCSTCIDVAAYVTDTEVAGSTPGLYVRNYSLPLDGSRLSRVLVGPDSWGTYIVPQNSPKNPWMSLTISGSLDYARRSWTPEFLASANYSLLNITIMATSDAPCTAGGNGVKFCPWQIRNNMVSEKNFTSLVAVGCRLYPCLKNLHGEVKSGVFTEELVSTVPARINDYERRVDDDDDDDDDDDVLYTNHTALRDPCVLADNDGNGTKIFTSDQLGQVPPAEHRTFSRISTAQSTVVRAPSDCLYHISSVYLEAMKEHLSESIAGRCTFEFPRRAPPLVTCGDKWWLDPLYASRNASVASLTAAMDGLAVVVTNQFRRTGSGPHRPRAQDDQTGLTVRGDVWEHTTCFSLQWKWLLLPAGLVVLTMALLVAAVLRSYMEPDQPVWKASVLPLMFYGLADGRGGHGYAPRDLMNLRKIDEISRNLKVRFDKLGGSGFAAT